MNRTLRALVKKASACTICEGLPLGPRPIFRVDSEARILIAGQAPGAKVHASGTPFDDPSGDRLRDWMGISRETFYDQTQIAILPMAFCYPGRGKSGDLPPRPECAPAWRQPFMEAMTKLQLTLVIGQYAQAWHLPSTKHATLTERVRDWQSFGAEIVPLPHPSPRNNIWLKKNPWFSAELLPELSRRVRAALS